MRANLNRGIVVTTAIVVGLIFGLAAGAYIFYAWVPADSILKNASPKYLNSDSVTQTPQYRDFYIVRAAEKYQRDLQTGASDPLRGAYDVLGVTTGDTSIEEALTMVSASAKVVSNENSRDGDGGQFTRNEELAMSGLAGALDKALKSGVYPKVDASRYAPLQAKTTIRIVGLLVLLVILAVGGVAIFLLNREIADKQAYAPPASFFSRSNNPATLREPSIIPAPSQQGASASTGHNSTVNMSPTSPGSGSPVFGTPSSRITAAIAPAETPIITFPPTVYRHGEDHFDVDFAINGSLGELIGESGASIADRIGLDTPSRVSALSLWVFDKNDFQSTTKVLLTDYAWNDSVTRSKLKARGDAVLAMDGGVVEILTSTLRVEVQVSDLVLNADKNPEHGYFQSVSLTFKVFRRQTSS